jgi:capsular exopolysaccharide synthesis family protein
MPLPDRIPPRLSPATTERPIPFVPLASQPLRQETLTDTLAKIWRHKRLVISSTLLFAAIACVAAISIPPRYMAEAQILIATPDGPKLFKDAQSPARTGAVAEADDRIQSERYVILSRLIASQVVDKLHLTNDPEFNPPREEASWSVMKLLSTLLMRGTSKNVSDLPSENAAPSRSQAERIADRTIDALISKVDVTVMGRSDVLSIDVRSRDAEKAARIANAVADVYLEQQRDQKVHVTSELENYMASRIADLRRQVEASEAAVEDYRRQYGLYVGETAGVASQQLTEMNSQLTAAQTAKAEADARLQEAIAVQRQGLEGDSVPAVIASPLIQALKQQQAEAERHLAELSATYGNKHPEVLNARAQILDIRRKIRTEIAGIIAGLRNEAKTADAHFAALTRDFGQTQHRMGNVNEKAIHLESLERDATVYRNLLEAMLNHEKEISWQRELERSDARVISPASPPLRPDFPPKFLIVLLGTMAGALISMMLALIRDGADRTFRRYEDVEEMIGLPVIALVPHQRGAHPAAQVLRKPASPYSEALRRIYIGIQMMEVDRSPKTVLFCSATPGEGKSVLIASLGRLMASNGKRVVVVDCDWRCPNIHRLFRMSNKGGLASLLTDSSLVLEDCVRHDTLSGLDVVPAGFWDPKEVGALTSERMRQLIEALAKSYDLVILDTAPVLVGAEVLMLSRMVDKVVFAVRWGHTRRDAVFEALRHLGDARGDLAGMVLSRVDARRYRQYARGPLNYEYARPVPGQAG